MASEEQTSSSVSEKELDRRTLWFVQRVFFWQRALGFLEVEIAVRPMSNSDNEAAWYYGGEGSGLMMIMYSSAWLEDENTNDDDIDKAAFHEVYESQLYKINESFSRFYSDTFMHELGHEIVRRAENCIFPAMKEALDG